MRGRGSRGGPRPTRCLALRIEPLDARVLFSADAVRHSLGPYLAPATINPRIAGSALSINGHDALNQYLSGLLGSDQIKQVQDQVDQQGTSSRAILLQKLGTQPFLKTILADQDTYTLLNSQAMSQLIGVVQIGNNQETEDAVRYTLPPGSVQNVAGSDTSLVTVPPGGGLAGFIRNVPTANIRLLENGYFSVDIPRSLIPTDAPLPQTVQLATGALKDVYQATGPLLIQALNTATHFRSPNAPPTVPGLRLVRLLATNRLFPTTATHDFVRLLRVAVERNVFTPTAGQSAAIQSGLNQFLTDIATMNQAGDFKPSVPPPAPSPVGGRPLDGTLVISAGAIKNLSPLSVAMNQTGLPLFGINFPGRIDAGLVIARNGDYGLILTARGPLLGAPQGSASGNLVGGDVRVEVSNATSLTALNGPRVEEGVTVGTALMSSLSASNQGGVSTFGASVGYGSGFQFGTGIAYSKVIPLGNINTLIPESPPR